MSKWVSKKEEHSIRLFTIRVLRETFRSKREAVAGKCRQLQNQEHSGL
jgi:hypothetical protein